MTFDAAPTVIDSLVLTLMHFLWQGVLWGLLAQAFRLAFRKNPPAWTYNALVLCFIGMAVSPLVTFERVWSDRAVVRSRVNPTPTSGPALPLDALLARLLDDQETLTAEDQALLAASLEEQAFASNSTSHVSHSESSFTGNWWRTGPADLADRLPIPLRQTIVALWLLGVSAFSLRLCGGLWGAVELLRGSQAAQRGIQQHFCTIARRMGFRELPRLGISHRIQEPLALQVLRPTVLLPASWLADVSPELLEAVLAHELAHLRRHDIWVNLFQRCVETWLFFHPAVWWLSRRIRQERELCCDADAVVATRDPLAYARALECVAYKRLAVASPQLAIGIGGTRMALLDRVKRVLGLSPSGADSPGWWSLGMSGVGLLAACWVGVSLWTPVAQGDDASPAVSASEVALADEEDEDGDDRREEARPSPEGARRPERESSDDDDDAPRSREERARDEGARAERWPSERNPPRPVHEIVDELVRAMRQLDERGEAGMQQKQEVMRHLMRAMNENRGGPVPPGGHPEEGARNNRDGNPHAEMLEAVRNLRQEVERLRAEMHEMRGARPPMGRGPEGEMGPGRPAPRPRDGEGPRPPGPRDGEGPRPPGPRDGEGPRPPGPRDGEGPRPRGPRDGEGPRPQGPRDGEGPRPRGPREGEGEHFRGPREGQGPRPEGPREGAPAPERDRPAE